MKDYKTKLHQTDCTGNLAVSNVTKAWRAERKIISYGELSLCGESLHGESSLYTKQFLERHPLEKKALESRNKEFREVYKSVSVHSRLTRQQKKRMGIIPSVRCE